MTKELQMVKDKFTDKLQQALDEEIRYKQTAESTITFYSNKKLNKKNWLAPMIAEEYSILAFREGRASAIYDTSKIFADILNELDDLV